MSQDAATAWVVSEDELNHLTDLFREFEGATDPRSIKCREAEVEFNSFIDRLYREKVEPRFKSITVSRFRSFARNECRLRLSRQSPPFPCV